MEFRRKNTVKAEFNMASMTDLIFLLLIFFMLTSNFVTPSGLPVNLPSSAVSEIVIAKVNVTISSDLQYYVNDRKIALGELEDALRRELTAQENVVVLHVDENVNVKYMVEVAGIASKLNAKVSLATQPITGR